jgi:hypothetical protein
MVALSDLRHFWLSLSSADHLKKSSPVVKLFVIQMRLNEKGLIQQYTFLVRTFFCKFGLNYSVFVCSFALIKIANLTGKKKWNCHGESPERRARARQKHSKNKETRPPHSHSARREELKMINTSHGKCTPAGEWEEL